MDLKMEYDGNSQIMVAGDTSNNDLRSAVKDEKIDDDEIEDDKSEADDHSEGDSDLGDSDMEQDEGSDDDYVVEKKEEVGTDESEEHDTSKVIACCYCIGKQFNSYSELCIHATEEHPLACLFCFESFEDRNALNKHQTKTNHTVWRCNICNEIFLKQNVYEKHVINQHYERCPYKCTVCNKYGTFKEDELNAHSCQVNLRRNRLFAYRTKICCRCYRSFGSDYSLVLHMCKEHAEKSHTHAYKCESCKVGFAGFRNLKSHVTLWHSNDEKYLSNVDSLIKAIENRSRTCVICDLLIPSSFSRHMRNNHPEVFSHKCDQCESYFFEETDLQDHRVKNHGGNPLVCIYCKKTCNGMNALRKHLNVAHGLLMPALFCFIHNKGFSKATALRKHLKKSHNGFLDDDTIEKKNRRREQRKKSNSDITGGKRYQCNKCGRVFDFKGSFESHVIKHTEKYKCDICFRTFESASNLCRHMVVHTGEKPYQCDVCGLRVSQKSALFRHRKVVHPDGRSKGSRLITQRRTRGPAQQKLDSPNDSLIDTLGVSMAT